MANLTTKQLLSRVLKDIYPNNFGSEHELYSMLVEEITQWHSSSQQFVEKDNFLFWLEGENEVLPNELYLTVVIEWCALHVVWSPFRFLPWVACVLISNKLYDNKILKIVAQQLEFSDTEAYSGHFFQLQELLPLIENLVEKEMQLLKDFKGDSSSVDKSIAAMEEMLAKVDALPLIYPKSVGVTDWAKKLLDIGNFADAIHVLEDAQLVFPNHYEIFWVLGKAQYLMGKLNKASEEIDDTILSFVSSSEVQSNKIKNLIDLAKKMNERGDFLSAHDTFQFVLNQSPNADAFSGLGFTYIEQRKLQKLSEARNAFSRALNLDPEHTDAYRGHALISMYIGDYKDATTFITKAMETNSADHEVHMVFGYILLANQDAKNAIIHFEEAVKWSMDKTKAARANRNLSGAYMMLGDMSNAELALGRAFELDEENPYLFVRLAEYDQRKGAILKAKDHLRKAQGLGMSEENLDGDYAMLAIAENNIDETRKRIENWAKNAASVYDLDTFLIDLESQPGAISENESAILSKEMIGNSRTMVIKRLTENQG